MLSIGKPSWPLLPASRSAAMIPSGDGYRDRGGAPPGGEAQSAAGDLDVDCGDRHPEGEQIGLGPEAADDDGVPGGVVAAAGAGVGEQVLGGELAGDADHEHQRGGGERGEEDPAAVAGAAGEQQRQPREQRQRQVEDDLDGERPGWADPDDRRRRPVVLEQESGREQVAGAGQRAGVEGGAIADERRLKDQRDEQQDHPVGGQDPQGPVPEVAGDARPPVGLEGGDEERAVEEEAGEREEQRHPERHALERDRSRCAVPERRAVGVRVEPGVADEDGRRRDCAQALDPGEPAATGGR